MELECGVCQEVLNCPKILPCLHTFCLSCLQRLADQQQHAQQPSFPCPSCGEDTQVPAAGVSAYKDNVYLDHDLLNKARQGLLCPRHRDREVELFCNDCQRCLCILCKVEVHLKHNTEDLPVVTARARKQIETFEEKISGTREAVVARLKVYETEREALRQKKESVRSAILDRRAALEAVLYKSRDQTLTSLCEATEEIQASLAARLSSLRQNEARLKGLLDKLVVSQGASSFMELFRTAQVFQKGSPGGEDEIAKLLPSGLDSVCRPVLYSACQEEELFDNLKAYIGNIARENSASTSSQSAIRPALVSEVAVRQRINCSRGKPSCEVFSLCPEDGDNLWVCYADGSESTHPCWFDKHGKVLMEESEEVGEVTFKYVNGFGFHVPSSDKFVKGDKLWALTVSGPNQITVQRALPLSQGDSPCSEFEPQFYISCTRHRACDINSTGTWLVTVAQNPHDGPDGVSLFQIPKFSKKSEIGMQSMTSVDASDTYTPPNAGSFHPKDVCFFALGGQELLLVADLKRGVHLVTVEEGRFQFLRYLELSCSQLVQPTALNLDLEGRLWVACFGGEILVCEPRPSNRD